MNIHLSSIQCDFFLTCDSWGLAHSSYRISIAAATILLVGPYYSITIVWWSLRSHPNIELPSGIRYYLNKWWGSTKNICVDLQGLQNLNMSQLSSIFLPLNLQDIWLTLQSLRTVLAQTSPWKVSHLACRTGYHIGSDSVRITSTKQIKLSYDTIREGYESRSESMSETTGVVAQGYILFRFSPIVQSVTPAIPVYLRACTCETRSYARKPVYMNILHRTGSVTLLCGLFAGAQKAFTALSTRTLAYC
jgi:hypothetical protein